MRGKHVEGNEVGNPRFFSGRVCLLYHVGVHHILPGHEIMFDLLIGVHELYNIFSVLLYIYVSPSLMSLVVLAISFFVIGLKGKVGY